MISLGDSGILPNQIEELEDIGVDKGATKKNQKRKTGWGPILRAPRPRRGHEDGRSMLEKAQDLKRLKILKKVLTQKIPLLLRIILLYLIKLDVLIFPWVLIPLLRMILLIV